MVASPELVMFGIQAALRLNEQFRRAFADSTSSMAITLPLPSFPSVPTPSTAESFYRSGDGQAIAQENLRVSQLLTKLNQQGLLSDPEQQDLLRLCKEHQALVRARAGLLVTDVNNPAGMTNEEISQLLSIRQWRPGEDPHPTMLRRMAGTLINIAVDYLVQMPDVVSTKSTRGKALRGFLEAIDSIDFVEDGRDEIIERLFIATVETIRDVPELITGDEKARILVHNVAGGLYADVKKRVEAANGDLSQQESIQSWGQLVLRSVLSSAGQTIFAEPAKFLGIGGPAEGQLVSRVGQAILDSILDRDQIHLGQLITRDSLDRIAKAALAVVGQHPELFGADNQGLKNLIAATAQALAQSSTKIGRDFLPEAIRIILEKTADNFELLLPGGPDQPARHLLIVAAKQILEQLSASPPAGSKWTLQFGSAEALRAVESVVEEVLQNPGWIVTAAGEINTLLGDVTKVVLDTLRATAPPRLTKTTALAILEAALRAAGKRLEFLTQDQNNRRLVSLALEAILATIFRPGIDAKAAWVLARNATVERLTAIVFEKLARLGLTPARIEKVRQVIEEAIQLLAQGGRWSLEDFDIRLEAALAA